MERRMFSFTMKPFSIRTLSLMIKFGLGLMTIKKRERGRWVGKSRRMKVKVGGKGDVLIGSKGGGVWSTGKARVDRFFSSRHRCGSGSLDVETVERTGYRDSLKYAQEKVKEEAGLPSANNKFMRTCEFYFDSYAAGFVTGTLVDYTVNSLNMSYNKNCAIHFCKTVVFSPAGNFGTLGDPYRCFPSAYFITDQKKQAKG
ncbi:hypothetical protein V6N13_117380 [Hibiscus sabdariffa]|uniref:Uncharacterized protein n=1 Tax=Hibiscus sabdariffa TaxID=183260 RepID=A0ABR2PAV1_9ROSI